MTALDFPGSPTDGDIYEDWQYNGTLGVWELIPVPEAPVVADTGFKRTFLLMGA